MTQPFSQKIHKIVIEITDLSKRNAPQRQTTKVMPQKETKTVENKYGFKKCLTNSPNILCLIDHHDIIELQSLLENFHNQH